MKKTLLVFGIILIGVELVLYLHWYKELYFMEFLVLLGLSHLAITAIFFGILTELLPREKRKLIINLSFLVFGLIIPILYLNSSRIKHQINQVGILTKGIVTEKESGAKTSPWLSTEFYYNGLTYKSTFHRLSTDEFKKVNSQDSVLIKFIESYPKMNRTEQIIKK